MKLFAWFKNLFRPPIRFTDIPATPFLTYWPGEIVRHMGRPKGDGFLAGCVIDAGRSFVLIRWENDLAHPERITDPAVLSQIIKQPQPAFSQL